MFNFFKKNHNHYYNTLVKLSRNLFFYNKIGLKDNFETKINILFFHFSILIISLKKKGEKDYTQRIFDDLFFNLENHIRELGYGDVAVNKKMKLLTKIFYDILLKIDISEKSNFAVNEKVIIKYLESGIMEKDAKIQEICKYFEEFYNYCFALNQKNMIHELKNYNYGSS